MVNDTAPVTLENNSLLTSLFGKPLKIPNYQRYYSWKQSHVNDLLKDTFEWDRNKEYLLGTVILHKEKENFDIVDGPFSKSL